LIITLITSKLLVDTYRPSRTSTAIDSATAQQAVEINNARRAPTIINLRCEKYSMRGLMGCGARESIGSQTQGAAAFHSKAIIYFGYVR
jgi:hypothetical protein